VKSDNSWTGERVCDSVRSATQPPPPQPQSVSAEVSQSVPQIRAERGTRRRRADLASVPTTHGRVASLAQVKTVKGLHA